MRPDFNKLLTERERIGHGEKYRPVRHMKVFSPDLEMQAGRESMKKRYNSHGDRKSFNENLNPLRNFLRCSVGRRWDDVYSEVCTNFDKRKVINHHILEHLFQYVATKLRYVDGVLCELARYRGQGWTPIDSNSYIEWYVDPRDGILKANVRKESYKQLIRRRAAENQAERDKVWRKIDEYNYLAKEHGIWFHYEAKDVPPQVEEWVPPAGLGIIETALFKKMTDAEKRKAGGTMKLVDAKRPDQIYTAEPPDARPRYSWDRRERGVQLKGKYFFSRKTANKQQLKAFGLDGTATIDETETLSHRKRAQHGIKL